MPTYLLKIVKKKSTPHAQRRLIPADIQPRSHTRLIDLNSPPYPLTDTNESDASVTKRRTDVIL